MMNTPPIGRIYKKSVATIRNEGLTGFGIKALQKIQKRKMIQTAEPTKKRQFVSLVDRESVMAANWSTQPYSPTFRHRTAPYTIAWVMSPPAGGGGHQNIFRFIDFLDEAGYKNNVYLYSTFDDTTIEQAKKNVSAYSKAKNTIFYYYDNKKTIKSDALFATGWETAYPVFNQKTDALKFYFVQDFEPLFYPMGTDYILAENTYKFGFHGITAGGWLADTLSSKYGMKTDNYNFGADKSLYSVLNEAERSDIFFYARPVTERRGFDLGLMALELFHKQMPNCTIHFAGWDVSEWGVPFPYVNHAAMQVDELNDVYNKCSTALVMSLTNMSLLPLELLSAGVIPVVNDGPNNRLVSDNENIAYIDASPQAMADALVAAVKKNNKSQVAKKITGSVPDNGWDESGKKVISIIEKELRRAK
jgi:glycosyltransferase involved in cell wall biosynthesis